jgi:hypothetical protein
MTECKLKSGVNWQGALKQKGLKQVGVREGLPILQSFTRFENLFCKLYSSE